MGACLPMAKRANFCVWIGVYLTQESADPSGCMVKGVGLWPLTLGLWVQILLVAYKWLSLTIRNKILHQMNNNNNNKVRTIKFATPKNLILQNIPCSTSQYLCIWIFPLMGNLTVYMITSWYTGEGIPVFFMSSLSWQLKETLLESKLDAEN